MVACSSSAKDPIGMSNHSSAVSRSSEKASRLGDGDGFFFADDGAASGTATAATLAVMIFCCLFLLVSMQSVVCVILVAL